MTLEQLVEESRQLPQDVRAELVERVVLVAHGGIAPNVEESWKQETRRRVAEIQSEEAQGICLDEALAAALRRVESVAPNQGEACAR